MEGFAAPEFGHQVKPGSWWKLKGAALTEEWHRPVSGRCYNKKKGGPLILAGLLS